MAAIYDTIGTGYTRSRQPDPRIAAQIHQAIGAARSVVNVGAGAGSYEPALPLALAIEPSLEMIRQRPPGAAPVLRGVAELLPFPDRAFDVGLATLTMHHWPEWRRGIDEMRRVARRIVVLTFDPAVSHSFWLVQEYFPAITALATDAFSFAEVRDYVGGDVSTVPVPADCRDGFLGAYWRRPEQYLDAAIRAGMSAFHGLPQEAVDDGVRRLERDLRSGEWHRRHADLLGASQWDGGYRLLVA